MWGLILLGVPSRKRANWECELLRSSRTTRMLGFVRKLRRELCLIRSSHIQRCRALSELVGPLILHFEKRAKVANLKFMLVRPSPFLFVYCRMRFLILGRSVGKRKKKTKIKLENCLELGGPVSQHNISGA